MKIMIKIIDKNVRKKRLELKIFVFYTTFEVERLASCEGEANHEKNQL